MNNNTSIAKGHVTLVLALIWLMHYSVDFMIGIWPIHKTIAGLDLAIAGLIAGGGAFIGEGMQLLFGPLSDRGWRSFLLLAGLLITTASVFLPYGESYFTLFLLFCLTNIGSGSFHPSAVSVVGSLTKKRKSTFIAIFSTGGALGMASSHYIYSTMYSYDAAHLYLLAIPTVFIFFAFVIMAGSEAYRRTPVKVKVTLWHAYRHFFTKKSLVCLYVTQVCNQAIFWGVLFLLPDMLHYRGYSPWICYGGGTFVFLTASALMMIPGGWLADSYSPRKVLLCAIMVASAAFAFVIFNPGLPTPALLFGLFLLGSSLGITNPVAIAFGNRLMPQQPGVISAVMMGGALCVSESLGPGFGGMLTKFFISDAAGNALACLATFLIIGNVTAFFLPVKEEEEEEEEEALENLAT